MASVSRTALFGKIHKVLKKYYKPVAPPAERTVLEHLLFACVLEDARYEPAEEAFAGAEAHFLRLERSPRDVDFRIVGGHGGPARSPRRCQPHQARVAQHFRRAVLFRSGRQAEEEPGPTVKWLEKMDGTSKFVVAYVVQAALGGHSIPVDAGTMAALRRLGPGERQGSRGRRGAGHRTGRQQEQGRGVRLA